MKKVSIFLSAFFVFLLISSAQAATPKEIEAFKEANQAILSDLLDEMDELDAALGRIEKAAEGERLRRAGGIAESLREEIQALKSSLATLRSSLSSAQQTSNKLSGIGGDASNSATLDSEMKALSSAASAAARAASSADLVSSKAEEAAKGLTGGGEGDDYKKIYMDEAKAIKDGLLEGTGFIFTGLSFANRIDEKIAAIRKFQADKLSKKTASVRTPGVEKNYAATVKNNLGTTHRVIVSFEGVNTSSGKFSISQGGSVQSSGQNGFAASFVLRPGETGRVVFSGIITGEKIMGKVLSYSPVSAGQSGISQPRTSAPTQPGAVAIPSKAAGQQLPTRSLTPGGGLLR